MVCAAVLLCVCSPLTAAIMVRLIVLGAVGSAEFWTRIRAQRRRLLLSSQTRANHRSTRVADRLELTMRRRTPHYSASYRPDVACIRRILSIMQEFSLQPSQASYNDGWRALDVAMRQLLLADQYGASCSARPKCGRQYDRLAGIGGVDATKPLRVVVWLRCV
ncbi:hypothetical protein BU23DRAFT_554435 [Bimuria novae-zelandiae CBS 107.79]|uniref:Uncharacterized protein n=1 Tax=Bimuria novae-zelandiae CBS 107.79 TaxID=1447943 RepID=A0A6A5VDP3_9PLEO|nr:hypothetical protein BU23DRAFT_554435 [Bimuria novae-zelandiae CBS 107.79]